MEREEQIAQLCKQILQLSHDDILIHLRFLDLALEEMPWQERKGLGGYAADGERCYYDPVLLLQGYRQEPQNVTRLYLHMLLHFIFSHHFQYDRLEGELWDLAADLAVEQVILELGLPGAAVREDEERRRKLLILREDVGALTAERIYRYLCRTPLTPSERAELTRLFYRDSHALWKSSEEVAVSREQWRKLSQRIRTDLKAFTRAKTGTEGLEKNLEETTRERYDYKEILQRFTVMGEDIAANEDEFDYIYYTYGLEHYGNLPLIEPLEYRESKKVREFIIAIDTSASCRGSVVRSFLRKTYSILKGTENFFHKINVHIIQCDAQVQSDTKITCDEDLETFLQYGKLKGFGATDFRPVFAYADKLKAQGEFENLKGLIYFTDGYGIYPERMPDYDVIFAFLEEDEHRSPVPPWSLKVILENEQLEEKEVTNEH